MISASGIFKYTLPPPSSTKLPGILPSSISSSSPSRNRSPRRSLIPPTATNNDDMKFNKDLQTLMIRALRGENISDCDPSLLPKLIIELADQWNFLLKKGFYQESEEAFKAFKAAKLVQKEINNKLLQQKIQRDLTCRVMEANNELDNLEIRTKKIENNMNLVFKNEIENLSLKQNKELEFFDNEWKTNKQRLYNKTSNELKILRRQEDHHLEMKNYKESEDIRKRADDLERSEVQRSIEQMEYDYQMARKPILEQHKTEMKALLKAQQDEKRIFESAKKTDSELISQKIRKIETELKKTENLNYVERQKLKSSKSLFSEKNVSKAFSRAQFNRQTQKEINVEEFNEVPLAPLNFAKKVTIANVSRRSLIRSPRANVERRKGTRAKQGQ